MQQYCFFSLNWKRKVVKDVEPWQITCITHLNWIWDGRSADKNEFLINSKKPFHDVDFMCFVQLVFPPPPPPKFGHHPKLRFPVLPPSASVQFSTVQYSPHPWSVFSAGSPAEQRQRSQYILISSSCLHEGKTRRTVCILISVMNNLHHSDLIIYGVSKRCAVNESQLYCFPPVCPICGWAAGKTDLYSNINIWYTLFALPRLVLFTLVCRAAIEYSQLIKFLTHLACAGRGCLLLLISQA